MKIRIINKNDPKDIGIVDLSKAAVVRTDETGLAVYFPGVEVPMRFSKSKYRFEYIEIAGDLRVRYYEHTPDWIAERFALED